MQNTQKNSSKKFSYWSYCRHCVFWCINEPNRTRYGKAYGYFYPETVRQTVAFADVGINERLKVKYKNIY